MPFLTIGLIVAAIVAALAVTSFLSFMARCRTVVPTNMVHIVQTAKKTTSYGKDRPGGNVYYAWPSHLPVIGVTMTLLPESVFCVELNDYEAYDSDRLPFIVDVRAFFRISDSNQAAHRVSSFDQLEDQLGMMLQGVVRKVLSTNALEVILSDRAKMGADFSSEIDPQLPEWGVQTVKSIEFMDIRDHETSKVISNIMAKSQSRIDKESRVVVAGNHQAAQQAEIDATREVQLRQTNAEQQVGQLQAEKQKNVGLAGETAKQEVLAQAKITAERDMEVRRVQSVQTADIERQVAEVNATQQKNVAIVAAEGQRQAAVIQAEADKARVALVSEGVLSEQKNNAQGIEAVGKAKAAAETLMLLAPVTAQKTLAQEIGANEGYQTYLVRVRQVEAAQAVGVANADALKAANIKVIATGGSVGSGMSSVGELFTAKGGLAVGSMLEGFAETPAGAAVMGKLNGAAKDAPAATK